MGIFDLDRETILNLVKGSIKHFGKGLPVPFDYDVITLDNNKLAVHLIVNEDEKKENYYFELRKLDLD